MGTDPLMLSVREALAGMRAAGWPVSVEGHRVWIAVRVEQETDANGNLGLVGFPGFVGVVACSSFEGGLSVVLSSRRLVSRGRGGEVLRARWQKAETNGGVREA